MAKLTLKNYRCFEDTQPAEFEVSPGFTAFVGPNNSGKSTALRLFYELRDLFIVLGDPKQYRNLHAGNLHEAQYRDVRDPREIRCNTNERELSIALTHGFRSGAEALRTVLVCSPESPSKWNLSLLTQKTSEKIVELEGGEPLLPNGESVTFAALAADFAPMAKTMYIGPYRHPIQGGGTHYDVSLGQAFVIQWDEWKTGPDLGHNRIIQRVTDEIARIFGFEHLDITVAESRTAIQVTIDGAPYRLRELGAGLAQFIMALCAVAVERPSLLLIDEPEIHLHPSLQADFLTALASHTSYGVMFATHSVGLARTIADRIYSFRREGQGSVVRLFDDTPRLAEFLGEMSFSAYRDLGYKALLLVEGVTDVKVVKQFLRLLGGDREFVLLPLGGSALVRGGVDDELAELTRLADFVYAIVDSERTSESGAPAKERKEFAELCGNLGIRVHLTHRRALDNYLTDASVKEAFGAQCRSLEPFEGFQDESRGWRKTDNWKAARMMKPSDLADVGEFLTQLRAEIQVGE